MCGYLVISVYIILVNIVLLLIMFVNYIVTAC